MGSSAKFVGKNGMFDGLMENGASVEICKQRIFPPPLAKVSLLMSETFAHFPRALLGFSLNALKKTDNSVGGDDAD
jgi:hypothetical protein